MYAMVLTITIAIDLFLFFPYRKKIKVIDLLLLGFMIYVAFHVKETPDISNYIIRFTHDYAGHDTGYIFISHLFRDHGATYYQFQNWYYLIAISCIAYGLIRLTDNRAAVYILYFFYPFLLNLVQMRNFMVLALLVLAIGLCYGDDNTKRKRILWCMIIGLAATQHILALGYLPFIFVWNNKKILKYVVVGSALITLLLFVIPGGLVNIISNIINLVADEARGSFFTTRATQLGIIVMILQSLAMMVIAKFSTYFVKDYNTAFLDGDTRYIETSHFEFVANLLYYSSIFWPLYYLNGNYSRLMQNEFMIVYMAIATLLRFLPAILGGRIRSVRMKNSFIISFICFIPLYMYNVISLWGELFETVVVPVFLKTFV